MTRLLLIPVGAAIGGACLALYYTGMAWPVATTIIRPWLPRPNAEPDPIA